MVESAAYAHKVCRKICPAKTDSTTTYWSIVRRNICLSLSVKISNKCNKRIAVRRVVTPLRELTCHIGSHSVTCHPAEVTFPPLQFYGAVVMTKVIARVHPVHLMNVDWAANPQTYSQLTWAVSPPKIGMQLPSTSTIAIVIITQPVGWYSFYRPTEGGRLSRPRHCSRGAQPVPKAAYRSGCRDKHNRPQCDVKLGPLTPQSDALSTRPLRPAPYP